MKKSFVLLFSLFFILGPALFLSVDKAAAADTIELKFAHGFSPKHTMQVRVFEPWAERDHQAHQRQSQIHIFPRRRTGKDARSLFIGRKGSRGHRLHPA